VRLILSSRGAWAAIFLPWFVSGLRANDVGSILWTFQASSPTGVYGLSAPAIGDDGTIYFSSGLVTYAVHPTGTQKWATTGNGTDSLVRPALGPDETIYVGGYGFLVALDSNGARKWSSPQLGVPAFCPPGAITLSNTIYVLDNALTAVNSDGSVEWEIEGFQYIDPPPIITQAGTLLVSNTSRSHIFAFSSAGAELWRSSEVSSCAPAAVDSDGTIYATSEHAIAAVTSTGSRKWLRTFSNPSRPVIDSEGIYFLAEENLHALDKSGGEKWQAPIGTASSNPYNWQGPVTPALGSDGTIYVNGDKLYAFNANGSQKWHVSLPSVEYRSSPAISEDGIIYIGRDDKLFAIKGTGTLAPSAWPKDRRDSKNSN